MERARFFIQITLFLGLTASLAVQARTTLETDSPVPANMAVLGAETYVTMPLSRLAHAQVPFIDLETAPQGGYAVNSAGLAPSGLNEFLAHYGYAAPLAVEVANTEIYAPGYITVYVGGYGGGGVGVNLGDGRSVIIGKYRMKGGAKTVKVREKRDHANGSASLSEAIFETIIGNTLDYEMPFGAYKSLAIITTGSQVENNDRALILAEDPVRFAHYILNDNAQEEGGELARQDRLRVQVAVNNIVEVLPKPAGLDLSGKSRPELLQIGVNEAIDRLAIQFAYAWAHKLYHGSTSSSNAALDGRMIDYGTFSAFQSYARVQILRDDAPSGDPNIFISDIVRPWQRSLKKHLPADLLGALPDEGVLNERFRSTFQAYRRKELVRMAGVFNEIQTQLLQGPEAGALGEILLKMAEAGHDKVTELWHEPLEDTEIPAGRYDLEKTLNALASVDLGSTAAMASAIEDLVPEESLRFQLISAYQHVFFRQRDLVSALGVNASSEAAYRSAAARMRNMPIYPLMRNKENLAAKKQVEDEFHRTQDTSKVQRFVQSRIDQGRREFRDADPFTIVLKETRLSSGDRVRQIFDAKAGQYREVTIPLKKSSSKCNELLRLRHAA